MSLESYWYIVAESKELKKNQLISRTILGHNLVCFRDASNKPAVFEDRCVHRCAKLSSGNCKNGILQCAYHGWKYDGTGQVIYIPSEVNTESLNNRRKFKAKVYSAIEQQGFIYVNFSCDTQKVPYDMPNYNKKGWRNVRLVNIFNNTLANCVENFIDVPHTVFVHPGIFRSSKGQIIDVDVTRDNARVFIEYLNETDNLGYFSKFLNPSKKPIKHTDEFIAPNITHVKYTMPNDWRYMITSQSVPISDTKTIVYTDITYRFGIFTNFIKWLIRDQAQKVIDQDVEILNEQMLVIEKYGESFLNVKADIIHIYISELIDAIKNNVDPNSLEVKQKQISFKI